ncbi:MAG: hypothetical protein Q9218_000768 [Villophora microphyllina]
MDTTAYLTRQGWPGDGNALHPSGQGIKKPLLVTRKTNTLGVGKKAHDAHTDQWWLRAFDETLRSLNDGDAAEKNIEGGNRAKGTAMGIHSAARWGGMGGLYGAFVRGEGLEGTISALRVTEDLKNDSESPKKKRPFAGPKSGQKEKDDESHIEITDQRHDQKLPPAGPIQPPTVISEHRNLKKLPPQYEDVLGTGSSLQKGSKRKKQVNNRENTSEDASTRACIHNGQSVYGRQQGVIEDYTLRQEAAVECQESGKPQVDSPTRKRKRKLQKETPAAVQTPEPLTPKDLFDQHVRKKKKKRRKDKHG